MLLDDEQVALDELVSVGRESVDHYEDALARVDDPALGELLETLREERLERVEDLCAAIRASGKLPRAAHADREFVDQMLNRVKATFSDDARAVLVDARIDDERRLEALARAALEHTAREDMRVRVEALRAHAGEAAERLAAARA